jgi:uncharacterized membrane protein
MKQFNMFTFFGRKDRNQRDDRWIFGSMLIGALLSLLASFVLSIEAVQLALNPNAALSCSVNIVINCATVALHPTANLFGFPNSFLGMIAEPVVITVAIAGLMGVKFPRLFMFAAQIGYTLGFVFALVLFYISMFIIQALCPWCLLVTVTTTFVFFAITRYNIRENNLYLPANVQKFCERFIQKDFDKLLAWTLIILMFASIILKYGADLTA